MANEFLSPYVTNNADPLEEAGVLKPETVAKLKALQPTQQDMASAQEKIRRSEAKDIVNSESEKAAEKAVSTEIIKEGIKSTENEVKALDKRVKATGGFRSIWRQEAEKLEGYKTAMYPDHKGIPTIGIGANLKTKDAQDFLKAKGYKMSNILHNGQDIKREHVEELFELQTENRVRDLRKHMKARGSNFDTLPEHKKATLLSLYYNNPVLVGPKLSEAIKNGSDRSAAYEIALNSNKNKVPGVAKRRLYEAKMFAGNEWNKMVASFPREEVEKVADMIRSIKDESIRAEVERDFPEIFEKGEVQDAIKAYKSKSPNLPRS